MATENPENFSKSTLDKIAGLGAEEKLALIRKAMYSDEHLLKVMFKIMLIADPEAADDIIEWLSSRIPL